MRLSKFGIMFQPELLPMYKLPHFGGISWYSFSNIYWLSLFIGFKNGSIVERSFASNKAIWAKSCLKLSLVHVYTYSVFNVLFQVYFILIYSLYRYFDFFSVNLYIFWFFFQSVFSLLFNKSAKYHYLSLLLRPLS